MHNLIILDDLNSTLYVFKRAPGSHGMPCSIKVFWENTNLWKRPEQKPHMKECFKVALNLNNVHPLCKDEFCPPVDVLLLNFGCCSPLGFDDVAALWDLMMGLKYFTYEISFYNTDGHLKKARILWSSTGRAVYPRWKYL